MFLKRDLGFLDQNTRSHLAVLLLSHNKACVAMKAGCLYNHTCTQCRRFRALVEASCNPRIMTDLVVEVVVV